MTKITNGKQIRNFKPQVGMFCPSLNVVCVKFIFCIMRRTASLTKIIISFINLANQFFPFTGTIKSLTLGRASAFIVWIVCASSAGHSVSFAAQMRFWARCFLALNLSGFRAMFFACKSRLFAVCFIAFHITVRTFEIQSARTCRNIEIFQFFINTFWVTPDNRADLVSRKTFGNIFLIKPIFV